MGRMQKPKSLIFPNIPCLGIYSGHYFLVLFPAIPLEQFAIVHAICSVPPVEISNFESSFTADLNRLNSQYGSTVIRATPWKNREKSDLTAVAQKYSAMEQRLLTAGMDCATDLAGLQSRTQQMRATLQAMQTASTQCYVQPAETSQVETNLAADAQRLVGTTFSPTSPTPDKTQLAAAYKRYADLMARFNDDDTLCTSDKNSFNSRPSVVAAKTQLEGQMRQACVVTSTDQSTFQTDFATQVDALVGRLGSLPSYSSVQKNELTSTGLRPLEDMLRSLIADATCAVTRNDIRQDSTNVATRQKLDAMLKKACAVGTQEADAFIAQYRSQVGQMDEAYGSKPTLSSTERANFAPIDTGYTAMLQRLEGDAACFFTMEDFLNRTRLAKRDLDTLLSKPVVGPTSSMCSVAAFDLTSFDTIFPAKLADLERNYATKATSWLPIEVVDVVAEETRYNSLQQRLTADAVNCANELANFRVKSDPLKARLDVLLKKAQPERGAFGKFVTSTRCFDGAKQVHANDCQNEGYSDEQCSNAFPLPPNPSPRTSPPLHSAACDDPVFAETAIKCAKNCWTCCERAAYKCNNLPNYEGFCAQNAEIMCADKAIKNIMVAMCPASCGYCEEILAANQGGLIADCSDGHSMCSQLKAFCDDSLAGEHVRSLCQVTCDQCGLHSLLPDRGKPPPVEADCRDEQPNCEESTFLCENSYYAPDLSRVCRKTCAFCLPPNYECRDQSTDECQRWIADSNYCNDFDTYPKAQRLLFCGASCGLC